jgi:ubiquinone/menaquinone biosynthesis C-methylase UbiE
MDRIMKGKSPLELFAGSLFLVFLLAWISSVGAVWPETRAGQSKVAQEADLKDIEDLERRMDEHFREDKAFDVLGIRPGMVLGEVGAGEGRIVFKLAQRVGPEGMVYAEDIFAEPLEILEARAKQKGLRNIQTVLGTQNDPKLPAGKMDMVFMTATFKFLKNPVLLFNNIASCLKTNGKVIVIEPEEGRFLPITMEPFPKGILPTRQHYLNIFGQTVFRVERVDDVTLPYLTMFVLSLPEGPK